jgi:hypothetical protein
MKVWYFFFEGNGRRHPQTGLPFAFRVHAVISTPDWERAQLMLRSELTRAGMQMDRIIKSGNFEMFKFPEGDSWDKLYDMAEDAAKRENSLCFHEFKCWNLKQ